METCSDFVFKFKKVFWGYFDPINVNFEQCSTVLVHRTARNNERTQHGHNNLVHIPSVSLNKAWRSLRNFSVFKRCVFQ